MEIDLNHAVCEVNNINEFLNSRRCEKGESGSFCVHGCLSNSANASSCSSNADPSCSSKSAQSSVFVELWHACAGPLISLPQKGDVVVYFPQGHLEQAASSPYPPVDLPSLNLPPQIFCRVVDVEFLVNKENDEVYTQLNLLPVPELVEAKLEGQESEYTSSKEDGNRTFPAKPTSQMFCKTLTASDTSTHGGFSVPRRAAEDCFPPLDYKEQRPSQELIAKDIHGVEWKFRHIYRGQPRRHLLTTGWSIFVSHKNMVSGDAVLFLRGEDGELHLGIKRALRLRNCLPDSIFKNRSSYSNVLSSVVNALSSNKAFHVFYSPRASQADFVIPYQKYVKATISAISVGTRFKMRFEIDDYPDRRFNGVVTGTGDIDPYRWPNSKWRCLMVRWDEDIMSNHEGRVSPWDIDFSGNYAPLGTQSSPLPKKIRTSHATTPFGIPISSTHGEVVALLDFQESLRPSKLQGQENAFFVSHLYGDNLTNHRMDFELQRKMPNSSPNGAVRRRDPPTPPTFNGFLESNEIPKVLQGQEICSLKSLAGKTGLGHRPTPVPITGHDVPNARRGPMSCFYPLALEGSRKVPFSQKGIYGTGQDYLKVIPASDFGGVEAGIGRVQNQLILEPRVHGKAPAPAASMMHLKDVDRGDNSKEKMPTFKLFGFSITEDNAAVSLKGFSTKRRCTKVHKQGSRVGRAVDLSRLKGYDELLIDLEKLFGMEGLLGGPEKGWRVLYTDSENDMMVVGDDPWHEFVEVATKIHIYTQEEVEKLSIGIMSDDTRSCLEEATVPGPHVPSHSLRASLDSESSPTVAGM